MEVIATTYSEREGNPFSRDLPDSDKVMPFDYRNAKDRINTCKGKSQEEIRRGQEIQPASALLTVGPNAPVGTYPRVSLCCAALSRFVP